MEINIKPSQNPLKPSWVFGYGSLIYKVDFPYLERRIASITGWQRRFWQGSHDHRGTPDSPGRVVTLVPESDMICRGVAYRVDNSVFEHLDFREKNGYQRFPARMALESPSEQVDGVLYVADQHNSAFLGPASMIQLANHIAASEGPSGSNRDYVLQLAQALEELGDDDAHVRELAALLVNMGPA